MANKEKLFTEFAAPTTQEWLDKIEVDLKGADFQKRLVWRTNEGFNVQPFYRREDLANLKTPDALPGEFPFVRGNKKDSNEWYVRQNIEASDPKAANAKALDILNKGIDSLGFHIPAIRIFCIISVTMMVTTATLYCGNIGVLSLAVPHISRHFTGNRFRDVLGGCLFFGAFLLLICRTITSFIYLDGMGFFPLATMTGLIMSPILALVLMQSRRGWE